MGYTAAEIALLREEHRAEARIWLAFVAQAAVSELLAGPLRTSYAALETLLADLITEAATGSSPPDEDATPPSSQQEARTLLALTDGLTTHVLIGHLTAQQAEEVLHAHLSALWERLGPTRPRKPA